MRNLRYITEAKDVIAYEAEDDGRTVILEPWLNGWVQAVAAGPAEYVPPPPKPIDAWDVNAERDRRLQADFEFHGKLYQRDTVSLQRITGAATLAGFAIAAGAQPGNLRWANPDQEFGWIASDNTITPMDAQTCFEFGQAAAAVETRLIFRAKELRLMQPIPADYTDDSWWQ